MFPEEALVNLRVEARAFEERLPTAERKALGQFFTGANVGRLLAHLAIEEDTARILDPMAGTGALLDAVCEAAAQRGISIRELHAIEIQPNSADLCERRLNLIAARGKVSCCVLRADAFAVDTYAPLTDHTYDLVITNPPYVRYQSLNERGATTRRGLAQIVASRLEGRSREIWATLAANYSGLADLSVPAWLLCALLVRPGGRLALVTPASWRSRDYAHVVRYLMLRAFELECVIEDAPPGWFPDALVGTHLVVARRRADITTAEPLTARATWHSPRWTKVEPGAASPTSLVGRVFPGSCPEAVFASWSHSTEPHKRGHGLSSHTFSLKREWVSLRTQGRTADWLRTLEPHHQVSNPLRHQLEARPRSAGAADHIPDRLRDLVPQAFVSDSLRSMGDHGIRVGQGLRTGCNRFFYVQLVDQPSLEWSTVTTSAAFGKRALTVPTAALRPVLHRQAELDTAGRARTSTRLLDLRQWALPEDLSAVYAALPAYRRMSQQPPRAMPDDLAQYVRDVANSPIEPSGMPVPALSAVRTNVRALRGNTPPRFWYMLPDLMPRHRPTAFLPRIVHDVPRTYANTDPELLVDANFSTLWSDQPVWSPALLSTFLNSVWCRALMEATGTRLGGGALKLEASHLRQLPLPLLDRDSVVHLGAAAELRTPAKQPTIDRVVLRALLPARTTTASIDAFGEALRTREGHLRRFRRGARSRKPIRSP